MSDVGKPSVLKRPEVQQFLRFCVVGFSSFAIDFGISFVLTFIMGVKWEIAKTVSFTLAVTNSFFWNRHWTFDAVGQREHHTQYAMFFSVNLVGYLLNLAIMKLVIFTNTGSIHGNFNSKPLFIVATLVATAVVVFWNFFANKHWTFKEPTSAQN